MSDFGLFKATYLDLEERLALALDIIAPSFGDRFSWTGSFEIEGDNIEVKLTAYYSGDEDVEHLSFPLEWVWSGGPEGDLAVTLTKGREYQRALDANKRGEALARDKIKTEKQERAELERLQAKYAR